MHVFFEPVVQRVERWHGLLLSKREPRFIGQILSLPLNAIQQLESLQRLRRQRRLSLGLGLSQNLQRLIELAPSVRPATQLRDAVLPRGPAARSAHTLS